MRNFIPIEDCVDGVMTKIDRTDDGGAVNLSTGDAARGHGEPATNGIPAQADFQTGIERAPTYHSEGR
jgi:hypothetical protein